MSSLISQVSYPVFLYGVFLFFMFASAFSFVVGVSFVLRNSMMLRLFEFLNESYSVRKAMKPLSVPHLVEPMLLRHPAWTGSAIAFAACTSLYLLADMDAVALQPVFLSFLSYFSALAVAEYSHSFLLAGNGFCLVIGLLLMLSPRHLSLIKSYTDRWYSLRKRTRPLAMMHHGVDRWALAHPTLFGTTLSIMSLGMGMLIYTHF